LKRPDVTYNDLSELVGAEDVELQPEVRLQVEIQAKYSGYIHRQSEEIDRQRRHEETELPADIDYAMVRGLSSEVRQKLANHRPVTLGQAARISGITPAAISLLMVHLKTRRKAS
jgi:tRNA uridine 5-carboxymethylaminomethyl modification enzyme